MRKSVGSVVAAAVVATAVVVGWASPASAVAPTLTVPTTQTFGVRVDRVFSAANGNAITTGDVDTGALEVEIDVIDGTAGSRPKVTLGTTAGLTITAGDGTADESMAFSGTIAAINAAFSGLKVRSDTAGSFRMVIEVDDTVGAPGGFSNTKFVPLTLTDLAPSLTVPAATSIGTNSDKTFSGATAPVAGDQDSPALEVEIDVTGGTPGNRPLVSLATLAGLTFTTGDGVRDSSMAFNGTIAAINAAFNGLKVNGGTTAGSFNFVVEVDDTVGAVGGNSNTKFTPLTITDVTPTLSNPGATIIANGVGRSIPITLTDTDSASLTATLTIFGGGTRPRLTVGVTTGLTIASGSPSNSLTVTMVGSPGRLSAALQSVTIAGSGDDGGFNYVVNVDDDPTASVGNIVNREVLLTVKTLPGAPTGVTAEVEPGGVFVSWNDLVSFGTAEFLGYVVQATQGGSTTIVDDVGPFTTASTITGLQNGVPVTFRVAAKTDAGNGPFSSPTAAVTPQAFLPFASANAMIDRVYLDLLGRAPTATERSTAVAGFTAGTLDGAKLIASIRATEESKTQVDALTRLYFAYFLRVPDRGGLMYWLNRRRNGTKLDTISQSFATSSEFKNRYGSLTNREFVELVYQNVLDREGEESGVTYWTNQLNSGKRTRGRVMTGFSESNEYKVKMAEEVEVAGQFILMLDRKPTATEYANFVAAFEASSLDAEGLAGAILGTTEYADRIA